MMISKLKFLAALSALLLFCPALAFAESLSGTLVRQVVDYPDHTSETVFYLELKSGDLVRLDLSSVASLSQSSLATGAQMALEGSYIAAAEQTFRVAQVAGFQAAPATAANGLISGQLVSGTRRMAIILLNFSGSGGYSVPIPCTAGQVTNKVYDDAQSMRRIYEVSSRNQLTFNRDTDSNGSADVFGPYTITASAGVCNYTLWASEANAAASGAGVDLSLYQHKVYVTPNYDDIGCSEVGRGDISCGSNCRSWIFLCANTSIYAHEVGHNLGYEHAGTDLDNNSVIDDEYGDESCPMGYATSGTYLFNAPHEDQLGWFDSNPGKVQVVSGEGTYHIGPLERDSAATSYPQMLKIQAAPQDYYYLSFRRQEAPISGLDSFYANKVSVHRYKSSTGEKTRLVRLLSDGQSFADSTVGFGVTMTSHDSDSATINVSFPSINTDTDNDGVNDYREGQDGSNPSDPGSYLNHLSSPVYLLWNGFLGMVNIAELINPSSDTSSTTSITASLYSISGQLMHTQTLNLSGGQQFDLILNQLPGFTADSYGIVKLEYTGSLEGRTSFYRQVGSEYEFAYSIPFTQPLKGTTGVSFNTYQPSTAPSEASFSVYNWLSLINLSGSDETFTINSYNQVGTLIAARQVMVPSFGRADVDGGHTMAGPGIVGLHEIIPQSSATNYIAQLIRYGANSGPGAPASGYFFAFPLSAHAGNGQPIMLPTSRQFSEANWIEVANLKNSTVNATVSFYNMSGAVQSNQVALAPHSQQHFFVDNSRLADISRGYVTIDADTPNSVIAQSMLYYRSSEGSIRAMYGVESREPLGTIYNGSYNLYLGMQNWLSLSSSSSQYVSATIETIGPGGGSSNTYTLSPYGTLVFPIHDASDFNTVADSYGFVRVTADRPNVLIADLTRMRRPNSIFDFAFPTAVRPE